MAIPFLFVFLCCVFFLGCCVFDCPYLQFTPRYGKRQKIQYPALYVFRIDICKAFDIIQHDKLWLPMLMGFPPQLFA